METDAAFPGAIVARSMPLGVVYHVALDIDGATVGYRKRAAPGATLQFPGFCISGARRGFVGALRGLHAP